MIEAAWVDSAIAASSGHPLSHGGDSGVVLAEIRVLAPGLRVTSANSPAAGHMTSAPAQCKAFAAMRRKLQAIATAA
ncbi:hypothetical protein GCM10009079_42980 [Ralstonia mannitolilytica]